MEDAREAQKTTEDAASASQIADAAVMAAVSAMVKAGDAQGAEVGIDAFRSSAAETAGRAVDSSTVQARQEASEILADARKVAVGSAGRGMGRATDKLSVNELIAQTMSLLGNLDSANDSTQQEDVRSTATATNKSTRSEVTTRGSVTRKLNSDVESSILKHTDISNTHEPTITKALSLSSKKEEEEEEEEKMEGEEEEEEKASLQVFKPLTNQLDIAPTSVRRTSNITAEENMIYRTYTNS